MTLLDSFADTDGTAVTSHTPDAGGSWTKHSSFSSGACDVRTNRARPGTSESVFYYSAAVSRASGITIGAIIRRVSASTSGMYGGVCAVDTSAKTLYEIDMQTTGIYLGKYVAGTYSALGSYSFSPAADTSYVIEVTIDSGTVKVKVDGTQRISVSDSSVTPTRIGVYGGSNTTSAGFHIDAIADTALSTTPDGTMVTYVSGTHDGVACGSDIYGRNVVVVEHTPSTCAATGATFEGPEDAFDPDTRGDYSERIHAGPHFRTDPETGELVKVAPGA